LKQLVFRRPPDVSVYPDYDLTRQVMVMNRLRETPITVPVVCWLDRDNKDLGTPYYVMEQVPTIGTASDFPWYHSQGLYFDATPKSAPPCGGAAFRPSPMCTRWTGAACAWKAADAATGEKRRRR
jgi:hypothetical protein